MTCWTSCNIRARGWIALLVIALLPGCEAEQATAPAAEPAASTSPASVAAPDASAEPRTAAAEENWDVFYLGDARIGYGVTRRRPSPDDAALIETETHIRLKIRRFDEQTESELKFSTVQTAAGELRQARGVAEMGGTPMTFVGVVAGNQLRAKTTAGGKSVQSEIPWNAKCHGFFAIDDSLRRSPMKAGESRSIRMLLPVLNSLADVELRAVEEETTELLSGRKKLLRIESVTTLADKQSIADTLWTDASGRTLKSVNAAMKQVVYRTTKEIAEQTQPGAVLDIGKLTLVKTPQPLNNPHGRKQIQYRVELSGGDPAKAFASDIGQQVTATSDGKAKLTVRAIRPDDPRADKLADLGKPTPPGDDERLPNSYLQSDDAQVIKLAQQAAGEEKDPWRTALALQRFVNQKITKKNFSKTFATASDVAANLSGDCTEHAVLLAALARARGIPSRVALGLVYVPSEQAFGFHMWTEVYIRDRWIGLDGTLGQGGLGAGHLKLTTTSLKEGDAMSSFLPVAQVLGRLKIEEITPE